jgi:hypothetical protein
MTPRSTAPSRQDPAPAQRRGSLVLSHAKQVPSYWQIRVDSGGYRGSHFFARGGVARAPAIGTPSAAAMPDQRHDWTP